VLIVVNLGRSWAIQELRERSWEDLHGLWHVCVRERNRIATSDLERSRIKAGYGDYESQGRDKVVSFAMSLLFTITLEGLETAPLLPSDLVCAFANVGP